jgi:hypothetical protein
VCSGRVNEEAAPDVSAGYTCHTAGKWHAGGHFWGQLPTQRGFQTSLGYLNGMEDHYTQRFNQLGGVDLWLSDAPALGRNGSYGAFMYVEHLVEALAAHDYGTPIFIYAAWQNTRTYGKPLPDADAAAARSLAGGSISGRSAVAGWDSSAS